MKRARTQKRDETIRYMSDGGLSQRKIAQHFGLFKTVVLNVPIRGSVQTDELAGVSMSPLKGFASGDIR